MFPGQPRSSSPPGRTRMVTPVAVANSRGSRANLAAVTFRAAASACPARAAAWAASAPVPYSTIDFIFPTLITSSSRAAAHASSTGPLPYLRHSPIRAQTARIRVHGCGESRTRSA